MSNRTVPKEVLVSVYQPQRPLHFPEKYEKGKQESHLKLHAHDISKDQTQCVPSPPRPLDNGLRTVHSLSSQIFTKHLCVPGPVSAIECTQTSCSATQEKLLLVGTPRMVAKTQDSDCFQAFCPSASPVTAEHEAEEGTTVLPSMEGRPGGR